MSLLGRILFIDDDPALCATVGMMLEREGFSVLTVETGEAGLDALAEESFDTVLCDLNLPGIQGTEVVRRVQATWPDTPVLMLTAEKRLEVVVEAMRAGAFDWVRKPVDYGTLTMRLRRAVEHRRHAQATNIYKASRALFLETNPRKLTRLLVHLARSHFDADAAFLYRRSMLGSWEPDAASRGTGGRRLQPFAFLELVGAAADAGEGMLLEVDETFLLAQPLTGRAGLADAVLVAARRTRRFGALDLERAALLGAQVSISLSRAEVTSQLEERVRELENARSRLSTAERMEGVGQMAMSLSLELRDPFHYLQTHLRELERLIPVLVKGDVTVADEARSHLTYALQGATRVGLAIDDLGRMALNREDVEMDLRQVIDAALRMAAHRLDREVSVVVPDLPVMGSPTNMALAISKLFDDAPTSGELVLTAVHRGEHIDVFVSGHDESVRLTAHVNDDFPTEMTGEVPTEGEPDMPDWLFDPDPLSYQ